MRDTNASRTARPTPQRVALFTGAYNHIADGVSLTLNRLVAFLEKQGAEVLVFAPTTDAPAIQPHNGTLIPATSVALPGRPDYRLSLGLSRTARATLRAFQPTLVHIATPDVLGLQALLLAKRMGTPVVASYHTHFTSYFKYYKMEWLENLTWAYLRWFYRRCAHIYVPTPSMASVLREHGIDDGLRLWPRGVETDRFHPRRRSMDWRRSLGLGDDEIVVSFVSRLVLEKGLGIYADVIEGLQAKGYPVRSLIVGDGPARAEIEVRLPKAIFTGYLGGHDLARAYASSDVFLFPSETETFGNVTLEAMASGLPAVCADATGSDALVAHGTTGYLAEPRNSADFLACTERLVADADRRTAMGTAARTHAEAYAWDAILGRIPQYYDELLNPGFAAVGDGALPPVDSLKPFLSEPA